MTGVRYVLAAVVLVLAGCGGDGSSQAPEGESSSPESETLNVSGSFTLTDYDTYFQGRCSGTGGYDDITRGAQVVVRDGDGKTLAIGELGQGRAEDSFTCAFPFRVESVPAGEAFYSLEVAHRGEVTYSADDIIGPIEMTLGD